MDLTADLQVCQEKSEVALITGATGFIGSHLVKYLREVGYKVRILSRQAYIRQNRYGVKRADWFTGDLLKPQSIGEAFKDVRVVFHLAAISNAKTTDLNACFEINLHGTKNIHAASVLNNVPMFVYFSSIHVYQSSKSSYARSKKAAEEFLQSCDTESDKMEIVILRPARVYGPGMRGGIVTFIRLAQKGLLPSLPSIKTIIPLISVRDLCQMALKAIESVNKKQPLRIYTLTDGEQYTPNRIENAVYQVIKRNKPKYSLPASIFYLFELVGKLAEIIRVKNSLSGLNTYQDLDGSQKFGRSTSVVDDFSSTATLESEMPAIIAALDQDNHPY